MGCCCSKEEESQDYPTERTRLLPDTGGHTYQANNSPAEYGNAYDGALPAYGSDEQNVLNKILHDTAGKFIDVGALECQALQEHEYNDRIRIYNQRLQKINVPQNLAQQMNLCILTEVPSAEKVLSAKPISREDFNFMNNATKRLTSEIEAIDIIHIDDVVIPFGLQ